ncbi:MAG: glycosyltransferase family 2 protein [Planctomycetota bacterium]
MRSESCRISVVVPAHNEEKVLRELHQRLRAVFAALPGVEPEFLIVNDGSTDGTQRVLEELRREDPAVAYVDLSRGFGKEIALSAGLDHATGDAVVLIDADLQDPPELIPAFIEHWKQGYDVVYGRRIRRDGETILKKTTAYLFYRLIQRVSRIQIPPDTGDFRLLSRRAVEALRQLPEHHRFMKGLFAWVGYPQKAVPYVREPRHAGDTKFNYWKLWNFAIEGITSFSTAPLKVASYLGLAIAAVALLGAVVIVFKTLAFGDPVAGYPSLMTAVLFLGGVQLVSVGVLGEYVGRIFNETKRRPLYFVKEAVPARSADLVGVASRVSSGKSSV